MLSGLDEEDGFLDPDRASRRGRDSGAGYSGKSAARAAFPVGTLVRHPQFGVGKVVSASAGANARATIQFRDVGTKTLVLEYARLERVS